MVTRWVDDSLLDDEGGCVFECGHYIASCFKNSRIRFTSTHLLSKQIDRGVGLTMYDTVGGRN